MSKVKKHKIVRMKIAELVPNKKNPRRISDEALAGLKKSVARYGLVKPIVWNKRTKQIVGGHQRVRVLLEMGETEVDVVVVDLEAKDEMALNVTLNNPYIMGEFDDTLPSVLADLGDIEGLNANELRLDELMIEVEKEDIEFVATVNQENESYKYMLVVECADEKAQQTICERLEKEGFKCRTLIV